MHYVLGVDNELFRTLILLLMLYSYESTANDHDRILICFPMQALFRFRNANCLRVVAQFIF